MRKLVVLFFLVTLASPANLWATPSASVLYGETNLGGGSGWRYDLTVTNTADPLTETGYDIFDFFVFLPSFTAVSGESAPSGWDVVAGSDFYFSWSLNQGVPPVGTDIAPGESLAGFSFITDSQINTIYYDVEISNPDDPFSPLIYNGIASKNDATPVPEPSSLLLFGVGIAGFAGLRMAARRRAL